MIFKDRKTIRLSMERTDAQLMADIKDQHDLKGFAEVQALLLKAYREGQIKI